MFLQDGAPKIAKLPYKWLNMVDITIVNGGYFMVYKPTYVWGALSCTIYCRKADFLSL